MTENREVHEWWSIERENGSCGEWIEVRFESMQVADHASATMMSEDETIHCIHRRTRPPETKRPEPTNLPRKIG